MRRVITVLMVFLPLGLLSMSQGWAAETIRVGVPTTLSMFQGDEMYKCVQMAVDEINAAGGVTVAGTKRKIELFASDLRDGLPGVPVPEALMGLEKMILDQKVQALLVGPVRSEALLPAMDIIAQHKVPFIGTVAMTPESEAKIIKEPDKYKYVFRAALNSKYLVGYVLGSLKQLEKEYGFKKLFVMTQDVLWARGSAEAISKVLGQSGWEVLGTEAYPTGASDFSPGLLKVKASGAQAILALFDMATSGILVKQWAGMKVPAVLTGNISPLAGPDSWKTYDRKIAGAINIIMESGNIPIPKIPASVSFWEAYRKRWGQAIQAPHGPSASYEAVYLLAEAIQRAGSLDGEAIAEAVKKTERKGLMGFLRFDKGNQLVFGQDPEQAALGCMFQWREGGKRVVIYPDGVAEDKPLLPEWVKSAK
ncbi:MAG: ABC transporter substrate-binding protein [Thermodesulfobacteriota bacterium]